MLDSNAGYLAVILAMFLATRSVLWTPVAAALVVLGTLCRADAFAAVGMIPLVLWAAALREYLYGSMRPERLDVSALRRAIFGTAIFLAAFVVMFHFATRFFGTTAWDFVLGNAASADSLVIPWRWRADGVLKTFSLVWLVLLPVWLAEMIRKIRADRWSILRMWPLLPIIVYVFAYRYNLNQPRYIIYTAPCIIMVTIESMVVVSRYIKNIFGRNSEIAIVAVSIAFVFNPFVHLYFLRHGDVPNNFVNEISVANNEGEIYSYILTGPMPAINFLLRQRALACRNEFNKEIYDFFSSKDELKVFFIYGSNTAGVLSHQVAEGFHGFYHLPYRPLSEPSVHRRHITLPAGRFVEEFSAEDKKIALVFANDDPRSASVEDLAFRQYQAISPSTRISSMKSFILQERWYPRYFNANERCDIDLGGSAAIAAAAVRRAKVEAEGKPIGTPHLSSHLDAFELDRKMANARWLETIPDYEMRLYDHVTTLKNRMISVQRAIWGAALLVCAAIWAAAWWVVRSLRVSMGKSDGDVKIDSRQA